MALKDKLGLAMIPSAYSGVADENNAGGALGKVHSVFPKGGNGDFDFSRGSDATRVNSQGYIESVQVLSDELVQNGDFEEVGSELVTNGDFSDGLNGWVEHLGNPVVSNGVVHFTGDLIKQSILTIGKTYKVTVNVTEVNSGLGKIQLGSTIVTFSGLVEEQTFYVTATDNADFYVGRNSSTDDFKIDNVSVKEVGQNWTFGAGWSVNDGRLNFTGSAYGQGVFQYYSTSIDKLYAFSCDLIQGSFDVKIGSTSYHQYSGGTIYVDADDASLNAVVIRPLSNNVTIDNISIKEVTRDTDIPRLDYSDGACPSLLLEPQRTNFATLSEGFDGTSQPFTSQGNVSVQSSTAISPDGKRNSVEFIENSALTTHWGSIYTSDFSVGEDMTISIFAKKGDYENRGLLINIYDGSTSDRASFDLLNGTVRTDGTTNKAKVEITPISNGWYRCSYSRNLLSSGFNAVMGMSDSNKVASPETYQGDGQSNLYAFGLQIEKGSYATSYIPTNGSSVTRLADVCNNAGDSTIFNSQEGVLFAEFSPNTANTESRQITLNNNTYNERVIIETRSNGSVIRFNVRTSGVNVFEEDFSVSNLNDYYKCALHYKENDVKAYVNGVLVGNSNSVSMPTGMNNISFDGNSLGNFPFYGNIKSLLYFDRALTDEELADLTSSRISDVLKDYRVIGERLNVTYESDHVENKLNELF